MGWFAKLSCCARRFVADDKGAAAIEFLLASPLLFGVMVFTAEYGQALRVRAALDGAVQDSARFLSRVAADDAIDGFGNPSISFYQDQLDEARQIIEARTGRSVVEGAEGQPAFDVDIETVDVGNFRTPYHVIRVTASIPMEMPLLSVLDIGLNIGSDSNTAAQTSIIMTSADIARWVGEAPAGLPACDLLSRANGECPTS
ncbi:MAG: TadE/TadG family type IV pilus assembly protein [Pseudomonadota bacterium]